MGCSGVHYPRQWGALPSAVSAGAPLERVSGVGSHARKMAAATMRRSMATPARRPADVGHIAPREQVAHHVCGAAPAEADGVGELVEGVPGRALVIRPDNQLLQQRFVRAFSRGWQARAQAEEMGRYRGLVGGLIARGRRS